LLALSIATLTGCVQQSTKGSVTEFRYEFWVPATVFLGGLAAIPLGWKLRPRSTRFAWTLIILGPLAVVGFAPSLFFDTITVGEDALHVRTGIWGTNAHDVKFSEIQQIKVISETSTGRRKSTSYFLLCEMKTGPASKVPVNSEVAKAAAETILRRVNELGIPVINTL
jgi:hypothetical protein